ncbi:hypothetical protein [Anaplasma ovis]|uniref:hypothetical protein n=1 Tax=Anaplasma ovis TaxID=142058 RepID=UPI000E3EDEC5|nr:hypothetical protein [Anaplasma ovis]
MCFGANGGFGDESKPALLADFERCGANGGFGDESKPALLADFERCGANGGAVSSALVVVTGFVAGVCFLVDASGPDRGTSEDLVLEGGLAPAVDADFVAVTCLLTPSTGVVDMADFC